MKSFNWIWTFLLMVGSVKAGPQDAQIEKILGQYFRIQAALSADSTSGTRDAAERIAELSSQARADSPQVQKIFSDIQDAARRINGRDLKQVRLQFFELSKPLFAYLHQFYSGNMKLYRYFCSMEKKGWIQWDKEIRNPYMGSSMLKCGELVS